MSRKRPSLKGKGADIFFSSLEEAVEEAQNHSDIEPMSTAQTAPPQSPLQHSHPEDQQPPLQQNDLQQSQFEQTTRQSSESPQSSDRQQGDFQAAVTPAQQHSLDPAPEATPFYVSPSPLMSLDVAVLVRIVETLQRELETARDEKRRMLDMLQNEQRHRHMLEAGRPPKGWENVWPRLKIWFQGIHGLYRIREGARN